MSILMFILFGLVVGFLARAIMPGRQGLGFIATALVGIAGSFVGGFIGNMISGAPMLDLHASGFIGSIVGALLVLAIMGWTGRRHAFG
ncbi:MAG: GlsB/YeaQ/YmgE family stress response membrane protein [Labilithrix sp.]